ncbi:ribbon-helix-helix protein, CopG family [Halovivax cerinus]|uniref:Ribbon-helix-helix protein, CopG family n=1 Tax=Halovivax cerinus TaxID=1487865 RepID=A0ABD5NLJ7_9EURY|nr:ribbon-helix-helix protein, CopG family [Halovivax cerinus]
MGNKNKTISFRVNEEAFAALQEIAEERDISLSAVFRDYVDTLIEHDGQVAVVPEDELGESDDENAFPPTVEVPKSFLREHERLELETEHLREQLEEHKAYVTDLRDRVDDDEEEVLLLDDLDEDEPYQLG